LRDIHEQIIVRLENQHVLRSFIEGHLKEIREQTAVANEKGPSDQLSDAIVSHGELMSTFLFVALFKHYGTEAEWFDVRSVMRTDSNFGVAKPVYDQIRVLVRDNLMPKISDKNIIITQGFIGSNTLGETTTLGRGGSDYSAAILGEALDVATISIWTDVAGVYTTDPRVVKTARPIPELTYIEAAEMANFGAKVLHPSTMVPAVRKEIPIFVGSSKEPEKGGTWVRPTTQTAPNFRALALRKNQTLIVLSSPVMVGATGFLANVFSVFAKYNHSIDLVSTSEISIAVTIDGGTNTSGQHNIDPNMINELSQFCHVKVETNLPLIAIIGNNMSENAGVITRAFSAINKFSVRMICYGASRHNLCFLLKDGDTSEALNALHKDLLED
ncbi:MAG: lysine-sensitive aspartokinase 3, partial [Succinivibrio sp.]